MSVEINATNFPDAAWRQYVSDNYDTNNDGILSDEEIANIKRVDLLNNNDIISVNCNFFTSLEELWIRSCYSITNLEIGSLSSLISVYVFKASIASYDLSGCPNLEDIGLYGELNSQGVHDATYPSIDNITFGQSYSKLSELTLYGYRGSAFSFTLFPNLQRLTLHWSNVTTINVARYTSLLSITIFDSIFQEIDCSDCSELENIYIAGASSLRTINLFDCHKLKSAIIYRAFSLVYFIHNGFPDCIRLKVHGTSVKGLDISDCPTLMDLYAHYTAVEYTNNSHGVAETGLYHTPYHPNDTDNLHNGQIPQCLSYPPGTIINTTFGVGGIVIITQPLSASCDLNDNVEFEVTTAGREGTPLWETRKQSESIWREAEGTTATSDDSVNGTTTHTLTVSGTAANDNSIYRCMLSNNDGSVITNEALLSVEQPPTITIQPESASVVESNPVSFSVTATGHNILYQWQLSTDGETWNDLQGATSNNYTLTTNLAMNGNQYRCKVYNDIGDVYSNAAILTVEPDIRIVPPTITSHPSSKTVTEGQIVLFTVTAEGEDLYYQWQTNQNGTWYNINGATSQSYSFTPSASLNNVPYRCQVSNAAGAVYSNSATLAVQPETSIGTPIIVTPITSITVTEGSMAYFRCVAGGNALVYQWKVKRNGTWYSITGANNNVYAFTPSLTDNGNQYRCFVSNAAGETYTNVATLTVNEQGPITLYGYHSIIISGKNTYGEWAMYPTSRPHVAPPEVKTTYVDVPGGNGGLDYTELLIGQPTYGYRKGSWEFMLIPQEKWPQVYKSLVDYLHGRIHTVVLEDDLVHEYTGRLSVNKWESLQRNSTIVIDYILEPEAKDTSGESYSSDDADLQAAARILRKPANAGKVITLWNNTPYIMPIEQYYEDGDNTLY